jgi:5,10-methenyltetrahydrofolate synthetase
MEDKASVRRRLTAARRALDPGDKARWDAQISRHLLALQDETGLTELAVFWPLAGEPDLHAAYAALADHGVQLLLPVVLERAAPLGFAQWLPGEPMHRDTMGIAVPERLRMAPRPGALLLPCLGFTVDKFRLGYGGGYYDRTLEAAPRPLTIGVAYECMRAGFPGEAHDVALDIMITERDRW